MPRRAAIQKRAPRDPRSVCIFLPKSMDWRDSLEASFRRIRAESKEPASGVPASELKAFEERGQYALPRAYRWYLLNVGLDPGDFLVGSDLAYLHLASLQESARALVAESNAAALPHAAFVFCEHQGYQLLFFRMDEGDDPPVYHYLEGDPSFVRVRESFSNWLADAVVDEYGPG